MAHGKKFARLAKRSSARSFIRSTDAVKLVKTNASAKFDETVELALNLGVDPKHADQMVRGVVNLPNGTGRTLRVAVFARGAKADEAREAGADVVGAEDLVTAGQGGEINFDRCIATPDLMPLVGRLGKVLGPSRPDAEPEGRHGDDGREGCSASLEGRRRRVPRREGRHRAGHRRQGLVRRGQARGEHPRLRRGGEPAKPTGAKGSYLLRAAVSSTMGPGVKVDLSTLQTAGAVGA